MEQKKASSAFDQLSGLVMKLHQEAMRWHDEMMRKHDELKTELKADIARLEAKVDAKMDIPRCRGNPNDVEGGGLWHQRRSMRAFFGFSRQQTIHWKAS